MASAVRIFYFKEKIMAKKYVHHIINNVDLYHYMRLLEIVVDEFMKGQVSQDIIDDLEKIIFKISEQIGYIKCDKLVDSVIIQTGVIEKA